MLVGTELLHGGFTWGNPVAPVAQGTAWLSASPSSITLAPKQVGHVAVTVAIPMKHQPGEHLLGVEFFDSMVIATAERLLALPPGTLTPVMED
jgi:hypothetical protein